MNCRCCNGEAKKRGFYRNKNFNVQRYECLKCGTSFSEKQPLDNLRVDFQQACKVAELLNENMGIMRDENRFGEPDSLRAARLRLNQETSRAYSAIAVLKANNPSLVSPEQLARRIAEEPSIRDLMIDGWQSFGSYRFRSRVP